MRHNSGLVRIPTLSPGKVATIVGMSSELDILKERGLTNAPKNRAPSPPDAIAAGRRYRKAVETFDQSITKIQDCYREPFDAGIVGVQQLIDSTLQLALDVRSAAKDLAAHPYAFMSLDSGVAYFGEIAAVSEDAYAGRISKLKKLRIRHHLLSLSGPATPVVPLSAHEHVLKAGTY